MIFSFLLIYIFVVNIVYYVVHIVCVNNSEFASVVFTILFDFK